MLCARGRTRFVTASVRSLEKIFFLTGFKFPHVGVSIMCAVSWVLVSSPMS